jgi:hypothetical protein
MVPKSGKYRMALSTNHNLEELFDLPRSEEENNDVSVTEQTNTNHLLPTLPESLEALDKIEAALPAVKGLEASDTEMDNLAAKATESFDNLMDLGMQVDSRYASEIFAVASTMLGHAITAKTAKMNKKLKMIDLQLKKVKLDRDGSQEDSGESSGQGRVLDRNELLRMLATRSQETPGTDK